jgi:hypothetical protein
LLHSKSLEIDFEVATEHPLILDELSLDDTVPKLRVRRYCFSPPSTMERISGAAHQRCVGGGGLAFGSTKAMFDCLDIITSHSVTM